MTDNELDRIFKEKLSSYEEPAPDVWEGIAAGLASRRRWAIVRRVGYSAIAVAASVAAGLFLFRNEPDAVTALPSTEVVTEIVTENVAEPQVAEDVLPMEEQIKKFVPKRSVAVAAPAGEAIVPEESANEQPSAPVRNESPVAKEADRQTGEQTGERTDDETARNSSDIAGDNLPAGFWDEEETRSTHTSQISILSNLSPFTASGNIFGGDYLSYAGGTNGQQPKHSIQVDDDVRFYMPLTFGLQFKTGITDRFYVGAGLSYTYLVSKFDALIYKVSYSGVHNQQHYIGVPVKFYYNFAGSGSWNVYASLGGAVEKCVGNRYIYGSNTLSQKVSGVQFSANAGVGIEYWFTPGFGIYFDPSLAYYFKGNQPLNIWTQQPLQAKLELGFRFDI